MGTNASLLVSVNHPSISGDLSSFLDTGELKLGIGGALIGYDKKNDEVIVCKPDRNFIYVFQVKEKVWTKISKKFTGLINY